MAYLDMPFPPDRPPHILEQHSPALPLPPLNLLCSSGFENGLIDLRWSLPSDLQANTRFSIIGVNIYRSFDSEFGPFVRLNAFPVGSNFFRDKTTIAVALQEDVSRQFIMRGDTDPEARWVFKTKNHPIHIQATSSISPNCTNLNVFVTIDNVPAFVETINAQSCEIELRKFPTFDVTSQKFTPAVLPNANSVVLATYRYTQNKVKTDLGQRIFYRVTTVAREAVSGALIETRLIDAAKANNQQGETLDYIWREAVRRNRFLLYHGGERVKAFIRKLVGPSCGCYVPTHKQSSADCLVCYGTGILGGYDGPYDIMIAPDDGEKAISQSNRGRTLAHPYDTWTGPSPLLSHRDFIVKINGTRYGIGPVRMPTNRGMQLQQFFPISSLDEVDIRYKVPVLDTSRLVAPQTRYQKPEEGGSTPMLTEREAIPDEREIRSNTVVGENYNRR